ncbi:MAG TPA: Ig-like domain-containing protein [Thermoanaerobaculia bacterium]|nr:Ig-like domain-containing protein [Thermoanaerobaculia bacterium]
MSYLQLPRLYFFGTFRAAPSTINNIRANWNPNRPVPPAGELWNPEGLHQFQLLSGTESWIPPGANVTPTTIQSLVLSNGTTVSSSSQDPLIGTFVISTNQPTPGKLVDLDPAQQLVSQIWGMQIAIGDPNGEQVVGSFTAAYFSQLFGPRNIGANAPSGLSAAYQSQLTNLQWPAYPKSTFLQQLQAASPDVLSIRFTLDLMDTSSTLGDGTPNPNFTLGRLTGAIGPSNADEPAFFTPARMLRVQPPAIQGEKANPSAPPPAFNLAPAYVDPTRNVVVFDLANSLQFDDDNPVQAGALEAAVSTSGGDVVLGTIDNSLQNYQQSAFLFEFPIESSQVANPLQILLDGQTMLTENLSGAFIDANNHVFRMDANTSVEVTLIATTFGGTPAAGQTVTIGPAQVFSTGVPDGVITFNPSTVTLVNGSATFTMSAADPGTPRQFIDGQVYAVPFTWSADTIPDPNAFLSVHVYGIPASTAPTWANVGPILGQYAHLYPGMVGILDIGDQATVDANAALLQSVLTLPPTSPHFMPVTRDLSGPRTAMVLAYLSSVIGGS